MTPLIKSRSVRVILTTSALLVLATGIALLEYDADVGAVCLLVGGIIGALPLGDFVRCPPSEKVVRPIMWALLLVASLSGLAAIVLFFFVPDLAFVAFAALALAIVFGAVPGFYFGSRVDGNSR